MASKRLGAATVTCSTGIQSTIMLAVSGSSTPDSSTAPSQMQFWQLHSLSDGCSEGCEEGASSQSEQQQHTGVADWSPPAAFASHERQRTGHAIKRAINSKAKRGLFIQFSLVTGNFQSKSKHSRPAVDDGTDSYQRNVDAANRQRR